MRSRECLFGPSTSPDRSACIFHRRDAENRRGKGSIFSALRTMTSKNAISFLGGGTGVHPEYPRATPGLLNKVTLSCVVAIVVLSGCRWHRELSQEPRALVGIIYVTGNEPFTNLSLRTEDGAMHMIQKDTTAIYSELWRLQGLKLRVRFRPVASKPDSSSIIVERYDIVKIP